MTDWTKPEDIRLRLRREWDKGRIQAAALGGEALFPLRITLRGPSTQDLSTQFPAAREWIAGLVAAAKEQVGSGYTLEWREIHHRQLGRNRIPDRLAQALRLEQERIGFAWVEAAILRTV